MEFTKAIELRKEYIKKQFSFLNDMQQDAVFTVKGPLLILAGAGSGKTSVLINRISNMVRFGQSYNSDFFPSDISNDLYEKLASAVENNEVLSFSEENAISTSAIKPYHILAITFTNKAAAELRERLTRSIKEYANDVMASTFHSLCVRILRKNAEAIGFGSPITIYDSDDQKRVVREIMKSFNIDEKFLTPKTVISRMSGYKDKLISPSKAREFALNSHESLVVNCYEEYQIRLKKANAVDFDDLIFHTVKLLQENKEILAYYQNRYRYIMVDEYQDTSTAQFELINLLSKGHNNLCVVGDDDQSIYRFRGATIENILSFENHYDQAKVIRLEQNYRSTSNILNAANSVIKNNEGRKGKTLWTDKGDGDKVMLYHLAKEFDEGKNIVDIIAENVKAGASLSDHAILYRMNMQSSTVENALARSGISYRIIGGHRFYDRLEIKDLLAYMNVVINPLDDLRLKRIINVPARKIGATTIEAVSNVSRTESISMLEALKNMYHYPTLGRAVTSLNAFMQIYEKLVELYEKVPLEDFVPGLIKITGYEDMLINQGEEGKTRLENIGQLISNIKAYVDMHKENATLSAFLEEVSLVSDIDNYDQNADTVTLMTIHSAKGLEFPYVFLVGVEEGIFPGEMSRHNPEDIEEERRLCYVGITRAEKIIYISHCSERMIFGQTKRPMPSRFINEIDKSVCEIIEMDKRKSPEMLGMIAARLPKKPAGIPVQRNIYQTKPASATVEKKIFVIGDKVLHKVFGEGSVQKVMSLANDTMLEILFENVGTKKVMANFAPIEKVD